MTGYFIAKVKVAVAVRMDRTCRWIFLLAFGALILGLYLEPRLS